MLNSFSNIISVSLLIIVAPLIVVLVVPALGYFVGLFAVLPAIGAIGMNALLVGAVWLSYEVLR